MKHKLETIIYGYDTSEFLPIYVDGKLANMGEFVAYKATRAFVKFSDAFDRLRESSMR